jgi:hypothetical protein
MDDRELEARLRARLHRRFDGAEPPATLRPVLADVAATNVRAMPRSLPVAWLAVATLIVAVVAGLGIRGWVGPGGPSPTATLEPTPSQATFGFQYIVLPPAGSIPSKASTSIASDTLALRLRAIGIGTFSSAAGYAITFQLPVGVDDVLIRVDDALIRTVLSVTGELSFVPLPPEDYGPGEHVAIIGEPLPVDEPELFGQEQIESAGVATNNGVPVKVHFALTPIGAAALEVYTSGHVGETFAVLIDGRVALLPVVQAPITGGTLEVSGPDPSDLAVLAAIVTSGTLPEEWREPRVPVVIPESDARELAIWRSPAGATARSAELTTLGSPGTGDGLIPIWAVLLRGSFGSCLALASPDESAASGAAGTSGPTCGTFDSALLYIDAVSGADLGGAVPAP